jgi:hypothetical protein
MKYRIDKHENGLDIRVDDAKDNQDKLMLAFQDCREGRCSCPTQEYKKLASLEIEQNDKGIQLRLKTKPGESFDQAEINRCLEYTAMRVQDDNDENSRG